MASFLGAMEITDAVPSITFYKNARKTRCIELNEREDVRLNHEWPTFFYATLTPFFCNLPSEKNYTYRRRMQFFSGSKCFYEHPNFLRDPSKFLCDPLLATPSLNRVCGSRGLSNIGRESMVTRQKCCAKRFMKHENVSTANEL